MTQEENMMTVRTSIIRLLAVTASAWAIATPVEADMGRRAVDRLDRGMVASQFLSRVDWRNLPPDQRVEKRREFSDGMAALTPEQRQQMRQQMREHWQQVPPEQRAGERRQGQQGADERRQLREERQNQREERRQQGWGRGDGRGRQ
ncbi:MAG: hypothetical protein ACM3SV_13590 [Betaproteobacteria bacterium]